jgi:hypothetical protein
MMESRGHTVAFMFFGKPGIRIKSVLALERI